MNCSQAHFAKVPRHLDLHISPNGAFLHIGATKTIQFLQQALSIPLPIIPGSPLCPVMAVINHLRLSSVGPSDPLFSVRSPSAQSTQPINYYHFSKFLAKGIRFRHIIIYLEMSLAQKQSAVNSVPSKIHQLVFY